MSTAVSEESILQYSPQITMDYTNKDNIGLLDDAVLEGVAVTCPDKASTAVTVMRGERQPAKYNDILWTFLFLGHLILVVGLLISDFEKLLTLLSDASKSNGGNRTRILRKRHLANDDNSLGTDDGGVGGGGGGGGLDVGSVGGGVMISILAFAFILSILSVFAIFAYAETIIKTGLVGTIVVSLVMIVLGAGVPEQAPVLIVFGCILFAVSLWNYCAVRSRIPYVAVTLTAAAEACRSNLGLISFSYINSVLNCLWIFILYFAVLASAARSNASWKIWFYILSAYWTFQVTKVRCLQLFRMILRLFQHFC